MSSKKTEKLDNSVHIDAEGLIEIMRLRAREALKDQGVERPDDCVIEIPEGCSDRETLVRLHQFFLGVSDLDDFRAQNRQTVSDHLDIALHLGFKFADLQSDRQIRTRNRTNASGTREKQWAKELAQQLGERYTRPADAWQAIPSEGGHPLDMSGGETYRSTTTKGAEVICHSGFKAGDDSLTKETFLKKYFRPAKKSRR